MLVLFVHGMGRTPLSGWRMLHRLRREGIQTRTFAYIAAFESFESIANRLRTRLAQLSSEGDYVVIGHSLGGILLRAAINGLPHGATLPKHAFLLGSPMRPSRVAAYLKKNPLFRLATGDCGQLLGSETRMEAIQPIAVPTTSVVGVRGIKSRFGPFGDEPNDGVVSVSEVVADWVSEQIDVSVFHSLLPASSRVATIIVKTLTKE